MHLLHSIEVRVKMVASFLEKLKRAAIKVLDHNVFIPVAADYIKKYDGSLFVICFVYSLPAEHNIEMHLMCINSECITVR